MSSPSRGDDGLGGDGDDFGIDHNANRPHATEDPTGRVFRESAFGTGRRLYRQVVTLTGVLFLGTLGAGFVHPVMFLATVAFGIAGWCLYRVRLAPDLRRFQWYCRTLCLAWGLGTLALVVFAAS